MKTKTWSHLPVCTSAFRWLEHYYCFHGHNFTRFHPVSGQVSGPYPKDARNYFMRCPNFGEFMEENPTNDMILINGFVLIKLSLSAGHGSGYSLPKCSEVKIDAITTDDTGKTYFFAGKGPDVHSGDIFRHANCMLTGIQGLV